MQKVQNRNSPPLPSPTETVSPIAVPHPHQLQPSVSSSLYSGPHSHDLSGTKRLDGIASEKDGVVQPGQMPRLSRGDSAEQVLGLTPITEDARSGPERQEDQGRSSQTLQELRRQMEELLVYQQMQQNQHLPVQAEPTPGQSADKKRRLSNGSAAFRTPPAINSGSTGSGGTIKPADPANSCDPVGQSISYPFPRVPSHASPEPPTRQSQFRLKLPSEKLKSSVSLPESGAERHSAATNPADLQPLFLPPQYKNIPDDAAFSSPNLYDLTLKLNADPGLEAWWSNLVDIFQSSYGAERVSLAVPGDATDLENVPWGQKALFNQNRPFTQDVQARPPGSSASSDVQTTPKNSDAVGKKRDTGSVSQTKAFGPASSVTRPSLLSRHSFAGFDKDKPQASVPELGPPQNWSKTNTAGPEKKQAHDSSEPVGTTPLTNQKPMAKPEPHLTFNNSSPRHAVFPVARPLEVEPDPLIKRAGVVKLFGRTRPAILTRQYSEDYLSRRRDHGSPQEHVQVTPIAGDPVEVPGHAAMAATDRQNHASILNIAALQPYDEYEQAPQSPWSQSPAPSPAPRTNPDQNPFFNSHTVDEGAFSKNPPTHDYSNTLPLEAIGVDEARTVIHIPLLHGDRSSHDSPLTLRFPVAVISLLTPIVPYPPNLRRSLEYLMPHLTTSFCLAQQYSQLERQMISRADTSRYGHLLGLGGTFSDASSELELVAGLSGHVTHSVASETPLSARVSVASPSDNSSTKFSPTISSFGTPGFELGQIGFGSAGPSIDSPGVASRTGGEAGDSYFNVPQARGSRENISHHRRQLSKSKINLVSSTPTSPGRLFGKVYAGDESNLQDPTLVVAPSLQEIKQLPVVSPSQQSSRQASTNSLYTQLQRELSRPFSDTIAQLMLNSIPLHLFLAKPHTGEVIWTNAKFDAYRRSQPQEQKLRDPWQNIHSSERDHVSNEWVNALRTGSQFTERVRVRRFNDESAYRWFIFRANPLLSSTGEVLYWIGSFLDIHEQHIAELKATQEKEKFAIDAKYRAFSNSIPQVVFEATENRGLIFVNEQWNLYTGQSLEEALDLGFALHVHPDDLEKCGGLSSKAKQDQPGSTNFAESIKATVDSARLAPSVDGRGITSALDDLVKRGVASLQKDESGRVFYSTEIRLRSRGGDFRWHLVRLVRVETSSFGSEEASWYGTCTDINDRKNLERELNKTMRQLNSQMESKTKFFSNMSHEIRTPLNGILGTIPFILDTQLDSDQRRMLDTIQNSSTNLRELVDNILDVSRVEAGKMAMVNSWFHVRSMIEDVIDTIGSRAIDKCLELNYLMSPDVPSMVIGDRFRIRQVLINLVGNAVKFTSQGEIHICCSLHHEPSAKVKDTEIFLGFDVVDTGTGFSSEDAERLMQQFSQLGEKGSQQHAGSGLGLFLSKQLVEMHGGKLIPSSKEGQGAKFSFHVKVDAPPPPSPAEQPPLLRQGSSASSRRRPRLSRPTSFQTPRLSRRASDAKSADRGDSSPGPDSTVVDGTMSAGSLDPHSATSSALPTPDIRTVNMLSGFNQSGPTSNPSTVDHETQTSISAAPSPAALTPPVRLTPPPSSMSVPPGRPSPELPSVVPIEGPFSIVILCPLDNTRQATKQHIEQVVPPKIEFTITTLSDVDEWKDMMQSGSNSKCTHLVLNLPATDDFLDIIQYVSEFEPNSAPVVVIISDLYQKRQISTRVKELAATGKKVFIVPKPVKPFSFSTIFDPSSKRELSKDRNQDMAREINDNFKSMSKLVKEVLGNKGYRILLVEDDETNRDVMLKYLDKVKLMSETACNGQECTNMVFSKEPGYYSLIICDIQMPIKNGYDTCRDIRAWEQKNHYPQIPIMALSANAMNDQIEDAARAGFNDYVTKPIKHNELGKLMIGLLDPARPLLLLRDRLNSHNPEAQPTRR